MSFGVDTLGGLSEKLKKLVNDTQNLYESFTDANQLYKQGKMGDREFFTKIGEYLVATSALNFLAARVIIEMKTAMEKGTSIKSPTGGSSFPSAPQAEFGIGGFVGAGGRIQPAFATGANIQAGRNRASKAAQKYKELHSLRRFNTLASEVLQQMR